jgi:hypothetical protein
MVRWKPSVGWTIGAVLVSSTVVAGASAPSAALPPNCDLTWDGAGDGSSWTDNNNWGGAGVPSNNDVVCIQTTDHVVISAGPSNVAQVFLDGSSTELEVKQGAGLFVDGGAESLWASGTNMAVNTGQLGGQGTLRVQGNIYFADPGAGGTSLTSVAGGGQPPADRGTMIVQARAEVVAQSLGLKAGYQVNVASGGNMVLDAGTFVTADRGTSTTIQPGGIMWLNGDGGYYQGAAVAGQPLSVLTNNGVLRKAAGSGTSVVDADFVSGSGQIEVQSGTLAMPDAGQVGAVVWPGKSFATGKCAPGVPTAICQPTTDPAVDPMSVSFTVPQGNPSTASVQLQELGAVSAFADAKAIGNEVLAHADNLGAGTGGALLQLRYSQPDVMSTPLDQVQVVHTTDAGQDVVLPDCVNDALPSGLNSCVLRPAVRTATNTFVKVLTTTTSRWHLRRDLPVENQGSPTAPRDIHAKRGAPFDGSVVNVTWTPPASEGAGPVSSYRVLVDGKVQATVTGTSAAVKNLGSGTHAIKVAAVNAAGTGPQAAASIKLAKLSKPRKVVGVDGAAGGKATVGVRWKPPADAGGLTIKSYKIAIFRSNGKKVSIEKVKASKHAATFSLPAGKYRFEVRALNLDRAGPWSGLTDPVRCR